MKRWQFSEELSDRGPSCPKMDQQLNDGHAVDARHTLIGLAPL